MKANITLYIEVGGREKNTAWVDFLKLHIALSRSHFRTTDEVSNWTLAVQYWQGIQTPSALHLQTASESDPASSTVGWCYYCCFSCWEQESSPKWTLVAITRPGGSRSALQNALLVHESTGNNVCGQSTTNLLGAVMRSAADSNTLSFLSFTEPLSLLDSYHCLLLSLSVNFMPHWNHIAMC